MRSSHVLSLSALAAAAMAGYLYSYGETSGVVAALFLGVVYATATGYT